MRNLTAQQKAALKKWFYDNYDGNCKFDMADQIDIDEYERIEEMHMTEIHHTNVNHYLGVCG